MAAQPSVNLATKLVYLLRMRSSKTGIPTRIMHTAPPLYQRPLPWWTRWTVGLIACDIFMTASAIELTWNRWSQPVEDKSPEDTDMKTPSPKTYILRPFWQRLGLSTAHLVFGSGIAAALLISHVRFVRTLTILPKNLHTPNSATRQPQLFLQGGHNWKYNGLAFPLDKCSLEEGRNETEVILRVAGERGHWYIGLENVFVRGRPTSVPEARQAILSEWKVPRGPKIAKAPAAIDRGWKSGPVRRSS